MGDRAEALLLQLERQLEAHEQLVVLCERQRCALIVNDTAALNDVVALMNECAARIHDLEAERLVLVAKLASEHQVPVETITASYLANHLDSTSAARMERTSGALRQAIVQLEQLNSGNEQLLKRSIHYIDKMFEWISKGTGNVAYGPRSERRSAPIRAIFDLKA